jgi:hypothetical protein
MAAQEEAFQGEFSKFIPGINRSERAYVLGLNDLRLKSAKAMLRDLRRAGKSLDDQTLESINRWINIASGRGAVGRMGGLTPYVNVGVFSTRYTASIIQLPFTWLATPGIRGMVIRDLLQFVGANVAILSMLKLTGAADVELDPRSTDWGKGRIGGLRFDFWGGQQQVARLVAQMITGERKVGVEDIYGEKRVVKQGRMALAERWVRGRLSPAGGLLFDITLGGQETAIGEKMRANPEFLKAETWNMLAPMWIADLEEAAKQYGAGTGAAAGFGSFMGVSVMTYYTPYQAYAEMRHQVMDELGYTHEMLRENPMLQADIDKDPRVVEAKDAVRKEAAKYGADPEQQFYTIVDKTHTEIKTKQAELDTLYTTGKMSGMAYRTQSEDLDRQHYEIIKHSQEALDIEYPDREFPEGRRIMGAIDAYFAILPEDNLDANYNIDWREVERQREEVLAALTPEEQQQFENYRKKNYWTDERYVLRDKLKGVDAYYEYIDGFWDWLKQNPNSDVGQSLPEGWSDFGTYSEWYGYTLRELTNELVETRGLEYAVADAAAKALLQKTTKQYLAARKKLRDQYLVQNPEVANLLSEFYGDRIAADTLEEAYGELPPELQTQGTSRRRRRTRARRQR